MIIRPLTSHEDYLACLALQEETWGGGTAFRESVGPAMLMVAGKVGGIAAGAFDDRDNMVGFVYGISGWRHGHPCHWSHMLAVSPAARDRDIGRRLKDYQRAQLLERRITRMYWTYDPLVARNAHINFMKLGVDVDEYVPDIYGRNDESTVDSVIGTDRFIVRWALDNPIRRVPIDPGTVPDQGPIVNARPGPGGRLDPAPPTLEDAPDILIAIPRDIQDLKVRDPHTARAWRAGTRTAFQHYLARGYHVRDFVGSATSAMHCYRLTASPRTPP